MLKKEADKFISSPYFEGMNSIRAIINGNTARVNDRRIIKILADKAKADKGKLDADLKFLRGASERFGFAIEYSPTEEIDSLSTGNSHGGIIAECGGRTVERLSETAFERDSKGFFMMLDGLEDPYNFGYALRSLYSAGVDAVIIPERNWMSCAGIVCRASAGASELTRLYIASPGETASLFRSHKIKIVCADTEDAAPLFGSDLKFPLLIAVGGEKRGISKELLDSCDEKVRITYGRAFPAALSAASAAAVMAFETLRQNS